MEYSTRSYIHTEHSMYDERGQQVIHTAHRHSGTLIRNREL
jgi:hypothetical protein